MPHMLHVLHDPFHIYIGWFIGWHEIVYSFVLVIIFAIMSLANVRRNKTERRREAMATSAVIATLEQAVKDAEFNGWRQCLDSVRASLRGYPNCGGDTEIMAEVERIVKDRCITI